MTPEQLMQRGVRAQQILEDPLVKEALSVMERDVIEMFYNCPERDDEGRRLLQQHLRNVRKFGALLQGIMETGRLEAHKVKQKSSFKDVLTRS